MEGGDTVVEVLIGAGTTAIDAGKEGAGGKLHPWGELGKLDEVAGVEGEGGNGGAGDGGGDVTGGGLEERGVGIDGDGLVWSAGLDLEIEADGLAGGDGDAGTDEMGKTGVVNGEGVEARVELGKVILAGAGGLGGDTDAGGLGSEGDAGVGESGSGGVGDEALEFTEDLR